MINTAEPATNDQSLQLSGGRGEVRLLNVRPDAVNMSAIKAVSEKIVELAAAGQLVPVKVPIFAEHPILKEALADKTIQITTSIKTSATTIFVPLGARTGHIILKKPLGNGDAYTLFSLPQDSGVELSSCLKAK